MDTTFVGVTKPNLEDLPPVEPKEGGKEQSATGTEWFLLPGGSVTITECARNVFRTIAPTHTLFQRGGTVVELVSGENAALILDIVSPDAFRSRLERYGRKIGKWIKVKEEFVLAERPCTKETANALMATREVSELLPPVNSLVNCPILAEVDGRLEVLGKGYHSVCGGVLVAQGDTPPLVCIDVAVKDLKEKVLGEFDFQSGGDYSRAIASLMTPALRMGGLLKSNIPVDVAEADKSQSGKTYRHKLICAVYNETASVIADRKGGVGSADESFAQALINGRPFIQFDNWRGKLDSQMQEAFLTAEGSFPARVPHRGEVTVDSRRFQLMLTSNGVETTRDLANRSSIIRIRKREDFSYQIYPEGDLLDHVKANQQHYLGCVFAVARTWHEQGCQRTRSTDHDFREWAQSLDWIVQELFGASPLMDGHLKAQERVSSPAMTWLRKIGVALEKTGHLEGEMFASSIVEFCEDEAIEIPGVKEAADSDQANKKVGILMKKVFGEGESIDVDDYHVERRETQIKRDDGNGYYPSRTYVFSKTPEPQQPHPPQ